jgi:AcrR family transcriptional regulator
MEGGVVNEANSGESGGRDRRSALVQAAYRRLATEGFEGLRTRDVAADVGINVATLHYYFPTKEALIRAVVGQAVATFGRTMPSTGTAAEQLATHLAALHDLLLSDPEFFTVLGELAMRVYRDEAIARIFRQTDEPWFAKLRDLIARGVAQGCLDARLDPDGAAAAMIAAIKGLCFPAVAPSRAERIDQTFRQLGIWLGLGSGGGLWTEVQE